MSKVVYVILGYRDNEPLKVYDVCLTMQEAESTVDAYEDNYDYMFIFPMPVTRDMYQTLRERYHIIVDTSLQEK